MRICLASWAPFHAGAEVALTRLAIELQSAAHDVFVVLGNAGETLRQLEAAEVRCHFTPMHFTDKWRWWKYASSRRQLEKLLKVEQPEIVHCNDFPTNHLLGEAAGRLGIPRICHHRFPFEADAALWLNKFGAERHIFVSDALRKEMFAKLPELECSPTAVVHDGLPLPQHHGSTDRKAARLQLQLPIDKAIVLFAGQIVEHKGVADLLRAWQYLPVSTRQKVEFVVVGEDLQNNGRYRTEMESLAKSLECAARFVGFQSDVATWQTAADIAVTPSHVEPLGLVVMEAMARALPAIGSNIGGIPEMIVNEETGLLVPPKNPPALAAAIERLVSDTQLRETFGLAARQRCEELFSIEAHAIKIVEQYQLTLQSCAQCSVA